jgi:hypothetical protein
MRFATVAVLAAVAAFTAASASAATDYRHLNPGGPANLPEEVPVNFVFIGFDLSEAEKADYLAQLPERYKPVIRSRGFYGGHELVGIHYTYDYEVFEPTEAWEDSFFAALASRATPAPRTDYQEIYNDQDGTRDVGDNHFIDAPTVEKWLVDHAPPGVDTSQDTIFFINWWGRDDFIDHVYTKIGEPDPDTGYDFGLNRASRKIIAWGGTTPDDEETGLGHRGVNRIWFFDLSAGPEAWGGSYDVTNEDIDGDGEPDYRLPSAWEYAPGGYRDPSELASDLGKLARYAAINLLFTPSPLYPPYLTAPRLPDTINMRVRTYEGWPGHDASEEFQTPELFWQEESELFPLPFALTLREEPLVGKSLDCYLGFLDDVPCYPKRDQYPAFANLFLFNALEQLGGEQTRNGTYTAAGFNYASDVDAFLLGFADDNWVDGTQSMVFNFIYPGAVASGYGLTTTQIHEYGHHFGMSHPHDGYDWETGIDYGPSGNWFLAWAADESNSMMSYIDVNWDFSQFDRDNMARFQAAGYILNANAVAQLIVDAGKEDEVASYLQEADAEIGAATNSIKQHNYTRTWEKAHAAYKLTLKAAAKAKVEVNPSSRGWFVQPKPKAKRLTVDYAHVDKAGPGTKRWAP